MRRKSVKSKDDVKWIISKLGLQRKQEMDEDDETRRLKIVDEFKKKFPI